MIFSWESLPKPFTVLAPMDDVTDTVFRQVVVSVYKPDVMMTEFVCVEGLCSEGRAALLQKLTYSAKERPLVAQVWGVTPDKFYESAKFIVSLGFDGIDINMGCPQRTVMKTGGGAALIEKPELVSKIIKATRDGIREMNAHIPLSVKTRIGIKQKNTDAWIRHLLLSHLDALTVHGRTAKDQSKVPAQWEEIQKAVDLRDKIDPHTVIIGNGDILSHSMALDYSHRYKTDGGMIGRGIFHMINCFDPNAIPFTQKQLLDVLDLHLQLFIKTYGSDSPKFVGMKKFFKVYIRDFEGSSALRMRFMEAKTASEAREMISTMSL